jgi:hypothetical protein
VHHALGEEQQPRPVPGQQFAKGRLVPDLAADHQGLLIQLFGRDGHACFTQ